MLEDDELTRLVAACFGAMDRHFGGHPIERKNARELMAALCRYEVPRTRLLAAAGKYLRGQGCDETHIEAEITKMGQVEYWLED